MFYCLIQVLLYMVNNFFSWISLQIYQFLFFAVSLMVESLLLIVVCFNVVYQVMVFCYFLFFNICPQSLLFFLNSIYLDIYIYIYVYFIYILFQLKWNLLFFYDFLLYNFPTVTLPPICIPVTFHKYFQLPSNIIVVQNQWSYILLLISGPVTCTVLNGGCEDRCLDTFSGPQCACSNGFLLSRNNRTCRGNGNISVK